MVRNPNYKQIEELLALKREFTHQHSMRAEIVTDDNFEPLFYLVYSYRTLIAQFEFSSGLWSLNRNKYSVTTSKQQSILRRVAEIQGVGNDII